MTDLESGAVTGGLAAALNGAGAVLDHVAHAVPSIDAVLPLYRDLLGGHASAGGIHPTSGHVAIQVSFANGSKIELLEPTTPESASIGRFLQERPNGGLHHLTFEVPSITLALQLLEEAGFHPFATNLDHPSWMETFLHPRETGGVLIQVVQTGDEDVHPDTSVDELLRQGRAKRLAYDQAMKAEGEV